MVYLIIGQPGSGKTTIAKELKKVIGNGVFHIDGDEMRVMFPNTDYSKAGRIQNIQRAFDIAKFISLSGGTVIISMVAPYRDLREKLKSECGVAEIYLHTNQIRGREDYFVKEFEPPTNDFMDVSTDSDITQTIQQIKKELYLL